MTMCHDSASRLLTRAAFESSRPAARARRNPPEPSSVTPAAGRDAFGGARDAFTCLRDGPSGSRAEPSRVRLGSSRVRLEPRPESMWYVGSRTVEHLDRREFGGLHFYSPGSAYAMRQSYPILTEFLVLTRVILSYSSTK